METTNDMRNGGEDMNNVKIVKKMLRSLIDNINLVVYSIEESKDIVLHSFSVLLSIHESELCNSHG